jgi:TonB family protein
MTKSLLTVILFCCCLNPWGEQPANKQEKLKPPFVKGMVIDFVTRSPINGARLSIEGTKWETYTDHKGEFELEEWKPGTYSVRITHAGYKPLLCKNFQMREGGLYASFVLKVGSPNDKPLVRDDRPLGQFVIDEDAEPIERIEPVYPESALRDKVEGTVLLNVYVNEEGEVVTAWVGQGVRDDLNRAAMEVIQYFKFKPAKVRGRPVGVPVTIPFTFKLADRSTAFPLKLAEGALTAEDIASALDYLGVHMYRFTYELPYKHKLTLSLDKYLDGKLKDSKSTRIGTSQPGKHDIAIFKYEKSDSIQFTVKVAAGSGVYKSITFGKISVKGFPSTVWSPFSNVQMQSGIKAPFSAFILSSEGVRVTPREPLESIVSKNKFVIVASVELQLE